MAMFYNESELVFFQKPKNPKFQDLTGQRFGKLIVIDFAMIENKRTFWFCKCRCGIITKVNAGNLKKGHTISCGCLQKQRTKEAKTTHGHKTNGKESITYRTWASMIDRCKNHNNKQFNDYGGRGITVCERWQKFENFLADMGERPEGMTIERIENDKGYYKENCRWATRKEQQNNTRTNRFLTYNGKTQTLAQWADETGFKETTISRRIELGWSIEKAINTPPRILKFHL